MTPATHVVTGAIAGSRFRNLGAALAAAFALHFALDAIYHFEAFYELSVPGGWTYEYAMLALFGSLAALGVPVMIWLWRRDRQVWSFACYAILMCAVAFEPHWRWKLALSALLTTFWLAICRSAEIRRWVLCGFVSYLPDALKQPLPRFGELHDAVHYRADRELGDWVSLLGQGRWKIDLNARIFDPYYRTGYAIEILIEAAILFGCLYWLVRRVSAPAVTLPDNQGEAVEEESLIGE